MLKMLKFTILYTILQIVSIFCSEQMYASLENKKLCQSGLREDNTNYIYCARQNLTYIPTNLNDRISGSGFNIGSVSNVLYDELVLSDNLIESIDSNTFGSSLKVKKLYLDINPLRSIHANAFKYLRNYLEEIYFEQKQLDTLVVNSNDYDVNDDHDDDSAIFEQSIFKMCFNLRLLSLKSYTFRKLSGNKFSKLNKLETLILSNVKLKFVDEFAFAGLENSLTELNLNSNALEWIPTSSIERLKRLKRLSLSQNQIKHLHSNAFFRVTSSLNTLDLSYNYLSKIDENAFNGPIQNSLKILLIQNNELKWHQFIHLLYNLHLLQEINVDFNKLGSLQGQNLFLNQQNDETCEFIHLKLNSLSMQGNGLTEQTLKLFTNAYDYDQDVVKGGPNMSQSKLLNFVQSSRKKFTFLNLKKLNFARNKIKQIPENFFHVLNMTQLEKLVLDRNPVDTSKFSQMTFMGLQTSLTHLNLNGIDFDFDSVDSIKALNLLENLQVLKLNGNNKNREISHDAKVQLDDLNLKSLVSLELQNNGLRDLPYFLCNLENLIDLDLSSNHLSSFNLDCLLFKFKNENHYEISKLKQLNLNNNPLKCDCKMRKLKIWLMRNYDKDLLDLIKWKCAEPFELNGKYLTSIDLNELTCPNSDTIIEPPVVTLSTSIESTLSTEKISSLSSTITTVLSQTTANTSLETSTSFPLLVPLNFINNQEQKQQQQQSMQSILSEPIIQPKKTLTNIVNSTSDYNYYSLIIGISLSISFICLLILVMFYLFCMRNYYRNQDDSNRDTKNYFNDFLTTSKYDMHLSKFCSPPLSTSSCSSSSTSSSSTSSSIAYSKTSKSLDMSTDVFQTNYLNNHSMQTNMTDFSTNLSRKNGLSNKQQHQHFTLRSHCGNAVSSPLSPPQTLILNNNANNNQYNHLNNSIFSINVPSISSTSNLINENHIYHEINTPTKQVKNLSSNNNCGVVGNQHHQKFPYENNLNYLVVSPLITNNRMIKPIYNGNNDENQFMFLNDQRLVNDFSNSLFV